MEAKDTTSDQLQNNSGSGSGSGNGAHTIETEIVSYTHNGDTGKIVLQQMINNNLVHSVHVTSQYVNADDNSISIVAKIQVSGDDEVVAAPQQYSLCNNNKSGRRLFSEKMESRNCSAAASFVSRKTVLYGTNFEELGRLEVSECGHKKKVGLVIIKHKYSKRGKGDGVLLLQTAGSPKISADSLSLEVQVSIAKSRSLGVEIMPVEYSARGVVRRIMAQDYESKDSPSAPPTMAFPRYAQRGRGDGRQRASRSINASNSGNQDFDGVINSSGSTVGNGNNSVLQKYENCDIHLWKDWFPRMGERSISRERR